MAMVGYIGVMAAPENVANEAITMSAPTAIDCKLEQSSNNKSMCFILPSKYDNMSKIPQPKHAVKVSIREVAPAAGVVHQFNGAFDESHCKVKAHALAGQLISDMIDLSKEENGEISLEKIKYEWWGYNLHHSLSLC